LAGKLKLLSDFRGPPYKGLADNVIATQLDNPDEYTFFVLEEARWSKIHLTVPWSSLARDKPISAHWRAMLSGR